MSRTRKALILVGFGYAQFGLAIISSVLLVPLILSQLGTRSYGLWLASGELLAYVAILDLGVFGVLPWMIAEADGRNNRQGISKFIVQGLAVGIVVALACAVGMIFLWSLLRSAFKLTETDWSALSGPLASLFLVIVLTYPLRVFNAALAGLQDVVFTGTIRVIQLCSSIAITATLLLMGYGLYALAAGAVPVLGEAVASLLRAKTIAPDLFKGWMLPTRAEIASLLSQGLGSWFGSFGVQMLAASNGLVIALLGHAEWVPIYACTARLSQLLLQMCWLLPDSGLVGLAQLHGKGLREKVGLITGAMLRVHLLLSGATACAVLALNPIFVRWWVGPELFGGLLLNALLAAVVIISSLIHSLVVTVAVVGNRMRVGVMTLLNGALHVILAIVLGSHLGLCGIALANILSGMLTTLPFGLQLLTSAIDLSPRWLLMELISPWLTRIVPLLTIAGASGVYYVPTHFWGIIVQGLALGFIYLWCMRALYHDLPLDPRLRRWLVVLRLSPPPISGAASTTLHRTVQ